VDKSGGVQLDPGFPAALKASVARYNGFAKAGRDKDFDRGLHEYDRVWNLLFSAYREGSKYPKNDMPNSVMFPFADKGPYYAFILAAGALDTNGGPLINEKAQVLKAGRQPIPGLYGAGNCIASPSRAAYWGGGCTIGLALVFGHIAGRNAAAEQPV
jgi:succinate dehydrogenase/fumarate reductase flavoprotein subunit